MMPMDESSSMIIRPSKICWFTRLSLKVFWAIIQLLLILYIHLQDFLHRIHKTHYDQECYQEIRVTKTLAKRSYADRN